MVRSKAKTPPASEPTLFNIFILDAEISHGDGLGGGVQAFSDDLPGYALHPFMVAPCLPQRMGAESPLELGVVFGPLGDKLIDGRGGQCLPALPARE